MNLGKVSSGLIVIFAGVFILLDNLDILDFNWSAVLYFWPVLIILAGVNLLLPKRMEGQVLSIMATVIVLLFFTYQGVRSSSKPWMPGQKMETTLSSGELSLLSSDFDQKITDAELHISGGAVEYTLEESTQKLIEIEGHSSSNSFSLSTKVNEHNAELNFSQKGKGNATPNGIYGGNKAKIQLNTQPIWDIELEIGAGVANFDLRPFAVRSIHIEGGASSIQLKMGVPAEELTKVTFEGGVSSLDIEVPKEVGCLIHAKSALSSLSFPGFAKQSDGSYQSDNYQGATKRIEIDLENGLSSINVKRY